MNLIILIIAHDEGYYLEMQELWRIYMNKSKNIKSFFIKYKSDLNEEIILENDTIFVKGYESFIPGCLDKTVKSIEFLLNNIEFDFIFRTNLSSVVNLNKLYGLLNTDIQSAGVIGKTQNGKFLSGAGILLNRDVCKLIIEKSLLP